MSDVVQLREWIMKKIESGKVEKESKLNHLYHHYLRMRIYEAEVRSTGTRECPKRN